MKRVLSFIMIMLFGAIFLIVPVSAQEPINPENRIDIFYFKDFALESYTTPNDYYFDFQDLTDYYDYFIIHLGSIQFIDIERPAYQTIQTNVRTHHGWYTTNRSTMFWKIYFDTSFMSDNYYILATTYEYIRYMPSNMESFFDDGYNKGYDIGYNKAMFDIFYNGFSVDSGYNQTESRPYKAGFNVGVETNTDFSFTSLLAQIFTGVGSFLAIELLPNITIGAIIAIPIVFGVIMFIIGRRKE